MAEHFDYANFVTRNGGYVTPEIQAAIRRTTILIAGCGIGSSVAICATRFGFENFVLVDGDVVAAHNLNRQFYDFADVGRPKVEALREQILRINPQARVEAIGQCLDAENVDAIVVKADIVFDTIDFLDLAAILALHHSARQNGVAILTALSIGFGAGLLCFPAGALRSLADLLAADLAGTAEDGTTAPGYTAVFAGVVRRIAAHLDPQVVTQIERALTVMEDGKPCPAAQVAVGSFTVAAMAVSVMHDLVAGRDVPSAPVMLLHSFADHRTRRVDITAASGP